jgi:hypothetical protein
MRAPLLFLMAALLTGCASTRSIDASRPEARAQLAEQLAGQRAKLAFASGPFLEVTVLAVEADSLRYQFRQEGRRREVAVPIGDICALTTRPGSGTTGKVGLGFIGAALLVALPIGGTENPLEVAPRLTGSALLVLSGVVLAAIDSANRPAQRYLFRSPTCNGPPERE